MSKLIKNWKLYTESLILEKSTLSQYFTKEEVNKLHKDLNLPHDVPIKKINIDQLKDTSFYSTIITRINGKIIVTHKNELIETINKGFLDNPSTLEIYTIIGNIDNHHHNPYSIAFDKKRKRSHHNQGENEILDYYDLYRETFIDKLMNILKSDTLSPIKSEYYREEMREEIRDQIGYGGFEYIEELIDFIIDRDGLDNGYGDYDDIHVDLSEIFDDYLLDINQYPNSYDEFKHDFSLYIIKNYKKY